MKESPVVKFLYGTVVGRSLLKVIMVLHLDRAAVAFLCSPMSKIIIRRYIRKHQIPMDRFCPGP